MPYSVGLNDDKLQPCNFQVLLRASGTPIAFCVTQSHAIRVAMALNLLDRQTLAHDQHETQPHHESDPAVSRPAQEFVCSECKHRFPGEKISTLRLVYAGVEKQHPCCPVCGHIIELSDTTTPTYDEWRRQMKK